MAPGPVTKENVAWAREQLLANANVLYPKYNADIVIATDNRGFSQAAIVCWPTSAYLKYPNLSVLKRGSKDCVSMEDAIGDLLRITSEAVGEILEKVGPKHGA